MAITLDLDTAGMDWISQSTVSHTTRIVLEACPSQRQSSNQTTVGLEGVGKMLEENFLVG